MKKKSKQIILSVLGILSLVILTVGVTIAVFTYAKEGTTENTMTTGTLKFLYTENTGVGNGINITNALPVEDSIGKGYSTEGYVFDFKVEATNTGTDPINYEVTLRKKATSTLSENNIKVYLTDMTENTDTEILSPTKYSELTDTTIDVGSNIEKAIYQGTVGTTDNYLKNFRLRMWVSNDSNQSDVNDKTFIATVNVYANANVVNESTTYKEAILNGTDPVLSDNLIPVTLSDDGTVTKADTNTEWYKYEAKRWANAVILKDEGATYNNGDTIPEENIESYFVWIPRYKYKIFDEGKYTGLTSITNKVQTIEVIFENKVTTPSNGNTVGSYLTHPAFTSFDRNGMWVGKFETGYDGATSTAGAQVNNNDSSKIIVKPNVYSWRSITVGNAFKASYDYQRNLDSHMMKNTEWGAVAYLQHSLYGSQVSVRVNNNSAMVTGYASTEEPIKGSSTTSIAGNRYEATLLNQDGTYTKRYNSETGYLASTTGNITGIYDMSGGTWEYVMGYTTGSSIGIGGKSGISSIYSDFFTSTNWNKYYDKYSSTGVNQYNNRILGDAIGEIGPFGNEVEPNGTVAYKTSWYKDYANFAEATRPWIGRGGYFQNGTGAGIFSFYNNTGGPTEWISFRIALAP